MAVVTEHLRNEPLRLTEVAGVPQEMTTQAFIDNISLGARDTMLASALAALDAAGLSPGSLAVIGTQNLVLEERVISFVEAGKAVATLTWRAQAVPTAPTKRLRSMLESVQTAVDKNGDAILLEHKGVQQGGMLEVLQPRHALDIEFISSTNTPGDIVIQFLGKVSSKPFEGLGTVGGQEWMCVDASAEPVNLKSQPNVWRITLTFVYNPDGHKPGAIFIDPETGEPPPGLVMGMGIKFVDTYEAVDFATLLSTIP